MTNISDCFHCPSKSLRSEVRDREIQTIYGGKVVTEQW